MKGIIFNAVEEAVTSLYSADTWDDLLDAAGVDGDYTSLALYDDAELFRLVGVACEATGLDPDELVRVLGRHAFPHLVRRYPEFVANSTGTLHFLQQLNDVIHPEVLKLHPDASPPSFDFESLDDGGLRVTYHSRRNLGALAEGLVLGVGDLFGEELTIGPGPGDAGGQHCFEVRATPVGVQVDA